MERIDSAANKRLKLINKLHSRKYRREEGLFLAEGVRLVEMAVESAWEIRFILVSDSALLNQRIKDLLEKLENKARTDIADKVVLKGCQVLVTTDGLYNKVADTVSPQGIMAIMSIKQYGLDDLIGSVYQNRACENNYCDQTYKLSSLNLAENNVSISSNENSVSSDEVSSGIVSSDIVSSDDSEKNHKFHHDTSVNNKHNLLLLVLDGVQDPGNAGTIIRTAAAAGIDGVICLNNTVDLFADKTVRSTMGSLFYLPIVTGVSVSDLVDFCRSKNIKIYVTALDNTAITLFKADFTESCAIVLGNEGNGALAQLIEASDKKIFIPMVGGAESLNVAIAGAVTMYEAYRQRLETVHE